MENHLIYHFLQHCIIFLPSSETVEKVDSIHIMLIIIQNNFWASSVFAFLSYLLIFVTSSFSAEVERWLTHLLSFHDTAVICPLFTSGTNLTGAPTHTGKLNYNNNLNIFCVSSILELYMEIEQHNILSYQVQIH